MSAVSSLVQLQRRLQAHVLAGEGRVAEVAGDAQANANERMAVYSLAYRLRLQEILENDYPGLRALAGESFAQLCGEYIDATPSRHFNARWYGDGLADFLRTSADWAGQPQLAEMAQFEWTLTLAFDAPDQPHATLAEMAALPPGKWPEMRPVLLAACRRQVLRWNVTEIRKAALQEQPLPPTTGLEQPRELLIWRKELAVSYRTLEADEAAALDALSQGPSFTELCELLCDWHEPEAVAQRAAGFLHRWIANHCLAPIL